MCDNLVGKPEEEIASNYGTLERVPTILTQDPTRPTGLHISHGSGRLPSFVVLAVGTSTTQQTERAVKNPVGWLCSELPLWCSGWTAGPWLRGDLNKYPHLAMEIRLGDPGTCLVSQLGPPHRAMAKMKAPDTPPQCHGRVRYKCT